MTEREKIGNYLIASMLQWR